MNAKASEGMEVPENDVQVIYCSPGLKAAHMELCTAGVGAIVLIGFATGTTPDRLEPVIRKRVESGVPVIILSNNPADPAGPSRLKYKAGQVNLKAGAIVLQKVNINHLEEVLAVLRESLSKGVRGAELIQLMKDRYFYQEGEVPPPPEWETEEGISYMRDLYRQTLVRQGCSVEALERELHRWEFGKSGKENDS